MYREWNGIAINNALEGRKWKANVFVALLEGKRGCESSIDKCSEV